MNTESVEKSETKSTITDSRGNPIIKGSIVGIINDELRFDKYQGLVVETDSDLPGTGKEDGRPIALFFNLEVPDYEFDFVHDSSWLRLWKEQHEKKCRASEMDFIFDLSILLDCPRICHFAPEELIVQERWAIETLAIRLFGDNFHTLYDLPKGVRDESSKYLCLTEDCANQAARIALYNFWGSVYPLHVCDECFPKINGLCGDGLIRLKKTFLLADGSPVE